MYEKMRGWLARRVPDLTLAFLGLGVVQGWLASMQAATQGVTGSAAFNAFGRANLFADLGAAPAYILLALLADRLAPLWRRREAVPASLALMCAGAACVLSAPLAPESLGAPLRDALAQGPLSSLLALVPDARWLAACLGLMLAGAGAALASLCWWEVYAVLGPVEAGFCAAAAWIVRELASLALAGYSGAWLAAACLALPFVSALMLGSARLHAEGASPAPRIGARRASFPWKPMALVAFYAFAYGCGTWLLRYQGDAYMHLGMVLPALIVCASVLFPCGRFGFPLVYRIILPAAIAGFLALLLVQGSGPGLATGTATVLVRSSYTSIFIYVSIVLCSLSRRYEISAAWLFSLFQLVHIAFLGFGTLLFNALPSMAVVAACIGCILVGTFIIASEPSLDSSWRIALSREPGDPGEQARLELAVGILARERGLSERQREITLLLAQGDTPRALANRLGISPGTAKAHVQHIYKKLGIHSREELEALLR